jgi:hypothetical protein
MAAHFVLPGTETHVDAKVQVVWADPEGRAGVTFVVIEPAIYEQLQHWTDRRMKEDGWDS